MKRVLILILAIAAAPQLRAEEINSSVIHNYNYVSAGYQYLRGDGGPDAHGGTVSGSVDLDNFLVGASAGYARTTDSPRADLWAISGAVGYVFRLEQNQFNIIPQVALSYNRAEFPGGSADATLFAPGISVSYALNNRASVAAGYTYGYNFDSEDSSHSLSIGGQYALTERVGLSVVAVFMEGHGFSALGVDLSYHF